MARSNTRTLADALSLSKASPQDYRDSLRMLYEFQTFGVDYLVERGGGFLWDEPGLGKTRQAILAARLMGGHVLVICPNSLKRWWHDEIGKVCPKDRKIMAGVGGRFGTYNIHPLPEAIPRWTIVHYTGMRMNKAALCRVPWSTVIVDECHFVKNRKAERTKALMQVTPMRAYRIGLTATPFGNNPADLWAQLRWMAPQVKGLRSYWRFYETFVEYEYEARGKQRYRRVKGGKHLDMLARVMSGYGIRRSKAVVAPHLPPLTDTMMPLDMNQRQADVYQRLRRKTAVEVDIHHGGPLAEPIQPTRPSKPKPKPVVEPIQPTLFDVTRPVLTAARRDMTVRNARAGNDSVTRLVIPNMLARMIRMEQWLSHPWTFDPSVKGAKLEWLLDWAAGFSLPAVIVTRFKASAERIAAELKPRCRYHITGDIGVDTRSDIIKAWRNGKHQFLVGTIDTIGTGLSFERAHVMVCYDQLYSTVKMEQTRQRVHRITTKHPVQIIYLYVQDTTNEIILNAFMYNWQQIEVVRDFLRHIQEAKT